jgi:GDP-mannose pyrophosphatase NudK
MSKFDRTKIEIVEYRTIWKGWSRLSEVTFDYTRSDGDTSRITWEIYDRGRAVAVLLFNRDSETITFVRQFRLPAYLQKLPHFLLEAPAGNLEEGDPADGMRREILEETGYRVEDVVPLFEVYMSPGAYMERIQFFAAFVDPSMKVAEGGGLDHENEDLELTELPLEDAYAMIGRGEIVDGKTVMLLQWAMLNRDALKAGRIPAAG